MTQLLVFHTRQRESLALQLRVAELHAVYEYHVALHECLGEGMPTPEHVKTLDYGLAGGSESLESIQPPSLDATFKVFYVAPGKLSP